MRGAHEMRDVGSQLSLDFGSCGSSAGSQPIRKERREATVRLVQYAPFPRVHRDERWRSGFTLDLSPAGARLRGEAAAAVGALLHVIVRGVDGRPSLESIARVVWSSRGGAGEARMGVVLLAARERLPLRVGWAEPGAVAA